MMQHAMHTNLPAPHLRVDYVDATRLTEWLAQPDVLAVFGFGPDAPGADDPRYLRVPLARREAMAELAAALGARGVTPVTMSVHVQPSGAHAGLHALIVTAPVADGVAQHAAGQLEGLSACCGPVARLRIERLD